MRETWAKVRYLFRRDTYARDLGEELDAHFEMEIEANIERGMSPEEARRVARREFGDPARVQESAHEAWLFHWLESILQDVRYGARQFRKAPGLTLAVIASLAIGLGANTAIFSLIDAVVLRPLPVADPDQLIQLEWRNDGMPAGVDFLMRGPAQTDGGLEGVVVPEPLLRGFSGEQTAFTSLIGVLGTTDEVAISAAPGAPAQQVRRHHVSGNFFDGLGVPPVVGRWFVEEEDRPGAEVTIVISHRYWSSRLGRDPDAIGRVVRINDEPARIVGVAPAGFFGLNRGEWIDVYQPLATHPFYQVQAPPPFRNYWSVSMLARLSPGRSASSAAAAVTPLFRNLVAETTGMEVEQRLELIARPAGGGLSWAGGRQGAVDSVSQALWILMLLVGLLLLIVCANVANLLLSRSETRRRESAVRLSLGAGRLRLIRQHLVESGMLAVIGGVAGLGLGTILARSVHALFQAGQSPGAAFAVILDWRVSAYATSITMLTALIFGLAPAWTAARSKVTDALKVQSRSVIGGGLRVPRVLVSVQFALSFAALVAAGLLGRSLENLYSTDVGFDAEQLSYATVHPGQTGVDRGPYMERLEQEIAAIPGVLAVAPLEVRPLEGGTPGSYVSTPGGPPASLAEGIGNPEARTSMIRGGPGFLEVLGIPLLTGRTLEARDQCSFGAGAPRSEAGTGRPICPVVVDERFAAVFFPDETSLLGQRFEIPNVTPAYDYEIVGMVADARYGLLREGGSPTMYHLPSGFPLDHFAIRAEIDSGALAAAVQQAVARVDPAVPLAEFHTQAELVDRLLRTERLLALVSRVFSLAALALAAVGLGGLLAYAVARRTNEIGIRMALGATGREVRRMVLGDSLRMVGAGVLIGVPAAYAVGQYLESLLFGLGPVDPSTALLSLVALLVIAGVASLLPAHRATRVNPLTALRDE